MADEYICQCGHNRSQHRHEWNKFQGRYDRSCRDVDHRMADLKACKCAEFVSEEDAEKARRAHMVCPCGHHVDEHYWSPSGQIQGVCHVSTHGDYPTCGCAEYAGPEESELADAQ
jgi:hypothetical protein